MRLVQSVGLLVLGLIVGESAMAAKMWLPLNWTWNVPFAEFNSVCDATTGVCNGVVSGPSGAVDVTGYVWASRGEAIDWIVEATSIPIDLTGTVYPDRALWLVDCDNVEEENCPDEFGSFTLFIIDDNFISRRGGSSASFHGVYRGFSPADDISTLNGYALGEGLAYLYDSSVDPAIGMRCEGIEYGDRDECWSAYGYWLYKRQQPVPEPGPLVMIGVGLVGLGLTRLRTRA